jgi:hypothetical protein
MAAAAGGGRVGKLMNAERLLGTALKLDFMADDTQ